MSVDWYLMDRKPFFNSGFEKDEHFNFAYDGFNEILDTTALGDEVVVYHNGVIHEDNATHIKAIVQNNTTDVIDNDRVKQILANIGTFEYGLYVYYKGKYYLVTDVPGDNKFYSKAIMQQCNYLLKWVNTYGKIVEQWCLFRNVTKEYATGLSEGQKLILGIVTTALYLPKNAETVQLKLNDRLIIDDYEHAQISQPMVYKITKLNLIQKNDLRNSLFIYTLEDTQYNIENDNKELMIADYYNRIRNYGIELISPNVLELRIGDTFVLNAKATVNGRYSDEPITYKSSDESVAAVSGNIITGAGKGKAVITAEINDVVKEVVVNVVDLMRKYQSACHIRFAGKSTLKVGLAKKFEAYFFDSNGIQTSSFPQWTILDEDGNAPDFIESWEEGAAIWLRSIADYSLIGERIVLILNGSGGLSEDRVVLEIEGLT